MVENKTVAATTEGTVSKMTQSAATVKNNNLSILRQITKRGEFKGLVNSSFKATPKPLVALALLNIGGYAAYKLSAGPQQLVTERNLTVNRFSGPQSLATYHFMHTSLIPALFNSYVLLSFGKYHCNTHGMRSFMMIAGAGALGASLLTAKAISGDQNYSASGANGISAALLAFHAFKTPKVFDAFKWARFTPLGWVALAMAYGIKCNDQGVLGGVAGGYLAFLIGIW